MNVIAEIGQESDHLITSDMHTAGSNIYANIVEIWANNPDIFSELFDQGKTVFALEIETDAQELLDSFLNGEMSAAEFSEALFGSAVVTGVDADRMPQLKDDFAQAVLNAHEAGMQVVFFDKNLSTYSDYYLDAVQKHFPEANATDIPSAKGYIAEAIDLVNTDYNLLGSQISALNRAVTRMFQREHPDANPEDPDYNERLENFVKDELPAELRANLQATADKFADISMMRDRLKDFLNEDRATFLELRGDDTNNYLHLMSKVPEGAGVYAHIGSGHLTNEFFDGSIGLDDLFENYGASVATAIISNTVEEFEASNLHNETELGYEVRDPVDHVIVFNDMGELALDGDTLENPDTVTDPISTPTYITPNP